MAHTNITKAERSQLRLSSIDLRKQGNGDLGAIRNPRRKAGHRRSIPNGYPPFLRQGANIGFLKSGFDKRESSAPFARCFLTGPVITEVIKVHT